MANDTFSAVAAPPSARTAPTDIVALVEGELAGFVQAAAQSLAEVDAGLEPLARAARDAVLAGGKRLRPTFAYRAWRGEDVANGTPTVLMPLARGLASPRLRRSLDRLLAQGRRANVRRIAELVRETGAATQLEEMITTRVADATAALEGSPVDPLARRALISLATAAAWRTS